MAERRIFRGPPYLQDGWFVEPFNDAMTGEEVGKIATRPLDHDIAEQMPKTKKRKSMTTIIIDSIKVNLGYRS